MIANPGRITHRNNKNILDFYFTTQKKYHLKAQQLNNQFKREFDMLRKTSPPVDKDEYNKSDNDSGDEDISYNTKSELANEEIEKFNKETGLQLERCSKCNVVRIPKTHHCAKCKYCIMKMDHHCPWINNCVGMFNQKYFILFCYYCFIGCMHSSFLTSYYIIYKHPKEFLNSALLISVYVVQITLALVFIIFNIIMLIDQWTCIKDDTTLIDQKQHKFIEARDLFEVLEEVFGESFSPFWFLPVERGNRKIKRK
jgi:hypothetical protein